MPKPALLPPNTVRRCRIVCAYPKRQKSAGDQPAAAPPGLSTPSSAGPPRARGRDPRPELVAGAGRRGSRRPARAMIPGYLWIARASRPRGGAANGGSSTCEARR